MEKKALVLGATGAMGTYLLPKLKKMGYSIDAVSLEEAHDDSIHYMQVNAKDRRVLKNLMKTHYTVVVDFLTYSTAEFAERFTDFLDNTDHYIFLSTYRVYAGEDAVITENSPRLLDASNDEVYLATDDYSLYKAREENILNASKYNNWTIVRPAITYSTRKFQLVTLEAPIHVYRAQRRKKVYLPEETADVQATMSWAGDVAEMIARLVLNDKAYRETFTVSTAEHMTWREVAEIYKELLGTDYEFIPKEEFLKLLKRDANDNHPGARYQLEFDRCLDRVMDNSKILAATGMRQEDLMPLYEGLKMELATVPDLYEWSWSDNYMQIVNGNMDRYEIRNA